MARTSRTETVASLREGHLSSTLVASALRAMTYLSGGLTAVLVARQLGPHDRGVWAVALLVGSLVALASECGIGIAVLRFGRQESRGVRSVLGSGLVVVLGASIVATAVTTLAIHFGIAPIAVGIPWTAMALALACVVPINVSAVCRSALLEDGDLLGAAVSQCLQAIVVCILVAGAVFLFGPNVVTALCGFLLAQILVALLVLARCVQRELILLSARGMAMRALLSYGLQAHVGTLALFLTYRLDLLLVNHILGPAAAGVYSIALTLSEILRVFPEAGQMAIYSHRTGGGQLPPVLPVARTMLLLTTVVGIGAATVSKWLIPLVFGAPFADASNAFLALVPGLGGLAVSYAVSPILVLRGRIRANSAMASSSLALMIALDWFVIPRWGLVGAACVSSVAYCALALLQVLLARREESFAMTDLIPRMSDFAAAGSYITQLSGIGRFRGTQPRTGSPR